MGSTGGPVATGPQLSHARTHLSYLLYWQQQEMCQIPFGVGAELLFGMLQAQAEVSSVGMAICSTRWRQNTRDVPVTPSTHTQCDRDLVQGSDWGGHAAPSTQIVPMCFLLVGAAAQGGWGCSCFWS